MTLQPKVTDKAVSFPIGVKYSNIMQKQLEFEISNAIIRLLNYKGT